VRNLRTAFVNSGILGHASVARLLREATARDSSLAAVHLDLSAGLGPRERLLRRAICAGPRPGASAASALLLARFRHELHAGLAARRRLAREEAEGGAFDLLHFHTQATAYASLARMRTTPSVVSIDLTQRLAAASARGRMAALEHAPNAAMDRRVFLRARAVVTTSRWVAGDLLDQLPALHGRVHPLPYPVLLDAFDAAAWAGERASRDGPARVLFVGGDWVRKGGPVLLDAWRRAGLQGSATLTLATDAPDVGPLPAGVERISGVRPYTDRWRALWRDADVFVLPTRAEAFGMVFQEAAAASLPAVGTRLGAVPEIVEHGRTGVLVEPGDADALAEALLGLVVDAPARARMGAEALAHLERTGSLEAYASRLFAILHEVADD
jgi:alpha-maltose-1-phosphate synthase